MPLTGIEPAPILNMRLIIQPYQPAKMFLQSAMLSALANARA
jgi:hypothetical protein